MTTKLQTSSSLSNPTAVRPGNEPALEVVGRGRLGELTIPACSQSDISESRSKAVVGVRGVEGSLNGLETVVWPLLAAGDPGAEVVLDPGRETYRDPGEIGVEVPACSPFFAVDAPRASPRTPKPTYGDATPSPLLTTEKGLALRELGGLSKTTLCSWSRSWG